MELYNLRMHWNQLHVDLEKCLNEVQTVKFKSYNTDIKTLSQVHERVLFIAQMCKAQCLNMMGKTKPFRDLMSCSNQLETLKAVYTETPGSDQLLPIKEMIVDKLKALTQAASIKAITTLIEEDDKKLVEEKDIVLNQNSSYSNFNDAMSQAVRNLDLEKRVRPKSPEENLYSDVNEILAKEKTEAAKVVHDLGVNCYKILNGSVAINHSFRERDVAGLHHSLIRFPGVAYTHSRRETITPIHIFHNQTLVALNLKVPRFKFGAKNVSENELFKRRERILVELREKIHVDVMQAMNEVMTDMTLVLEQKYLYTKAFKGIAFLWFANDATKRALGQFPETMINLMWD